MPNIRIHIVVRRGDKRTTPARFASRRVSRHAFRSMIRFYSSTAGVELDCDDVRYFPSKRACAYRRRDYYDMTGLSPRLERHINVALGL